jgi:glycosyltransferase involved in cell wall biosynthesis
MIFLSSRTDPDVLIVTNMWPRDDDPVYGIFVKRQIDSLKSLGLSCDVLFVEGYRTRWEYVRAAFTVLRLTWSRRRPAVVHAHGGETALAVCWYRRRGAIVSYCGDDLLGTPRSDGSLLYLSRVRRFVLRNLARAVGATITKSAEMEATLPRSVRARNAVIPNGVDRTVFFPASHDEARSQLGWRANERIVLFAADPAVERKRYWLAEAACREAAKVSGPVRLEVASGLTPNMLPRLMRGADCLLLPSILEGSPNVVKEAMACNLPVICTDVGDVRDLLAGVEPSWICGADAVELGNALVECLTERPRSNGWEQSAWLDQDEIARRVLDVYRGLSPELATEQASPPRSAVRLS